MYNPESQIDELIQHEDCSLKIHVEENKNENVIPGTLSIQSTDRGEIHDKISYKRTNSAPNPGFEDEDKLSGRDDSYGTTAESRSEDSPNDSGEVDLELDDPSQSGQNALLSQDFFKREDGSPSSQGSPNGFNPNFFDRIQYDDFGSDEEMMLETDTTLPIANVTKLMKRVLPSNAKIAKLAKDMIRECVAEFIWFITSEATEMCATERRKTLNADDIYWAMRKLGFGHYNKILRAHHNRWKAHRGRRMLHANQRVR